MTYEQKRVKKFMQFFNQECPDKPKQINEDTAKLRAHLMWEELIETIVKGLGLSISLDIEDHEGTYGSIKIDEKNFKKVEVFFKKEKEVDLEQVADGVGDILVTSLGTSVACGIDQEKINIDIFDSNDSKLWEEKDLDKAPENFTKTKIDSGLYIVRGENGKIAKSPSYRPANPGKFIEEQLK